MRYLSAGTLRPLLAAIAGLASATAFAATAPVTDIPARQEVLTFTSLTLSDQQFLTGDQGGTEVLLGGVLSLPPGEGRVPVVLLQHGSGGVGANITYWQRQFNQAGIATFAVDGFSGRGITSTATNQAQLGRLNFVLDDYRAGALLARHPRIDPGKIILMGFSRGGQASLYAAMERFDKRWKSQDFQFAGYLSFYPDCSISFREQDRVVAKPLRVYHGLADNYDPYSRCEGYLATLKQQGADLGVHTYPHAEHGFDSPYAWSPVVVAKGSQTVRECRITENAKGELINQQTGKVFSYQDSCVVLGPKVGPDAEATRQATRDVLAAVRAIVK
ncbi:dienelactone hydrolase family protein [Pseudomonas sp. HR1]|uniref:dienelactone hydrolase family protein n=1 Tax=Pseudomonas sp. HR1 TaxID=1463361 RepID=UPI0025437E9E|nr:dienelactone hydrolase family protein [Pseudomonas sp. HR1]MDK4199384.1 dienelactone hydrolase family protein [Pseudomonas sp. HR1]